MDIAKAKKHYIMALAIMFVVVSLSDTTYSLFLKEDSTEKFNYNTGIIDLQFIEDEQISIRNAFPTIDSEGVKQEPYTLTIKNVGTVPYIFDLKMLSTTMENVLDTKFIKYQVNNSKPKTLFETSNVIASNIILYPEEEKTFKVKVWLDINTPNAELGKTFMAKILTNGQAMYRTLDQSGANYPNIIDDMIPVYYDETEKVWKKADNSNTIQAYEWYNYETGKWANVVSLEDTAKHIYDVTRKNNLYLESARTNNGNYITEEKYLDINLTNYNNNISNIFRIKFKDLTQDNIYIISNDKMSYYYDTTINKFVFKIGNSIATSNTYNLEKNNWYILGYTYNNNKVSFYINGNKISSANIYGNVSSNESFKIGTDSTFSILSNFELGDLYIYKDILTDEEISNNYQTTINIIYDNLVVGYNDFEPKTIKEYYQAEALGTTILNQDISQFYVWIPRFKYKLWNVTGSKGIDSYDAYHKGIDIIFEKNNENSGVIRCEQNQCYNDSLLITKVTTEDNDKYYTHPAFTKSNSEITGIWVSKYEISTSSDECNNEDLENCISSSLNIQSKPGNTAWRYNYLSSFYYNIKRLNKNNIDNYNIIKNTDWGALTYLTHSKYGLCQNESCSSIGTNNTYISGNEITDSTTNNIYGVFDLSGSASEFVMANYNNENNTINTTNTRFETIPTLDDYDLYKKNEFILGDATKEISLEEGIWYNNHATFINETNNWFIRGGIGTINDSGIYYYNATTDKANEYISTRIVIK